MNLKKVLLEEEDFQEQMDEDLLTHLGSFIDMIDDDLITDDIEEDINLIFDKYMDLLEKLDIDSLEEDVMDHLEYILDLMDEDLEGIDERAKVKVIRKGKMIKRLPARKGYKVVGNRYVRMKPAESKKRSRSAKKSARKSRTKTASKRRKMKISLRKRKSRNL